MKGIFSGRKIKELKGRSQRITRSQTAANAYAAIIKRYGSIQDNAHYFHTGKGNWHKYSLENDKKRTGKIAGSIAEWREKPHKLDWSGVDTKAGSVKKPRFSVTYLKSPAGLTGRKGKSQIKTTSKAILKNVVKPHVVRSKSGGSKVNQNLISKVLRGEGIDRNYKSGFFMDSNEYKLIGDKGVGFNFHTGENKISMNEATKIIPKLVLCMKSMKAKAQQKKMDVFIDRFISSYGPDFRSEWVKRIKTEDFTPKTIKQNMLSQLKQSGKLSSRKRKVQPKKVNYAVTKHIQRTPIEEKRLRLLSSMIRIEVTTDPHLYYEKWETQLKNTFSTNADYKKWLNVNRKYLDDHPRIVKDLAYTHIAGGNNQSFRDSEPAKPVTEDRPSKLVKTEPKKSVKSKPSSPSVSPTKTITINGKKFTINASNAVAFVTELRSKTTKQKLASMIKAAKENERKGKDVSDDWAKIVTYISENMGQSSLKRLPYGPEGYAKFMGKKVNYQDVNEKAYQIMKRNEKIKSEQVSTDNLRENLKWANDGLRRELQNLKEQKDMLNAEKDVNMIYELQKEIKYTKSEIDDYKKRIATNTKLLNERVRPPHPNNIRSKAARAKLPKSPSLKAIKKPGKLARRTENKLKPAHKPALKGNYMYASFQRPIWAGFNPGVSFQKVLGPLDNYSDPRWNRKPHDVIITSTPISKEKQYDLQLTDLREGAKIKELIKYVDKFSFMDDNMKGQLKGLVLKGRSKAEVDVYIEKARKLFEKKMNM